MTPLLAHKISQHPFVTTLAHSQREFFAIEVNNHAAPSDEHSFRRRIMTSKRALLLLLTIAALAISVSAQTARRPLRLDDLARFRDVRDPQISPDGQWVAYVVSTIDPKEDKSNTHIWLVGYDGKNDRQITFSSDSESAPRWSPASRPLCASPRAQRGARLPPRAPGEPPLVPPLPDQHSPRCGPRAAPARTPRLRERGCATGTPPLATGGDRA